MKQPIPRHGTEPLKVGDRVQIVPEWQDLGDDKFGRFVIEAPDGCTRVRIQAVVPGLFLQPAVSIFPLLQGLLLCCLNLGFTRC